MSINFANVKAITIPEGSVKSIASGGVTLWQLAPQTTAYRLLEYIKFSGTEYVLTDHKPTNNRYYYLNFEIASKVNDRFIFAAGGDATDAGLMRCTVRTSASYFQRRYGRNSSSNGNIGTTCVINTFYQLRFRIFDDFQAYFAIADSNGTVQGSSSVTAVTFTPANMNTFGIMGYGQGSYASNLVAGKVYRYYYRIGDASGELGCNAYPVQRKSDGRCGLYDTVTNTFYPMDGKNITWTAAGPTVTEEWTYGGYTPSTIPGVTVPAADWVLGYGNSYWYTNNKAFWNDVNSKAGASTSVRVKLTISVYNPTDDKTYYSSTVNTITLQENGDWTHYTFNFGVQYSASSVLGGSTLNLTNGPSGSTYGNILIWSNSDIYDAGCSIGDVILEFLEAL